MVQQHPAFFPGLFFKYLIKKELKTYLSLITNSLPEKIISLSFSTWLPLMPWWKVSDISREKGGYILSYNSFNIASESLSCLPNAFHIQAFVVTLRFLDHRVNTSHCLRQEGVIHKPSLQSIKCAISSLDTGVPASPEAPYVLVSSTS